VEGAVRNNRTWDLVELLIVIASAGYLVILLIEQLNYAWLFWLLGLLVALAAIKVTRMYIVSREGEQTE